MKNTVIVDKNGNTIKHGDKIVIRISKLNNFPDYYHLGYYKVHLDPYFGMEFIFEDLVTGQTDMKNQYIGVSLFDRTFMDFYPIQFIPSTNGPAKYGVVIKGKNALVEFDFTDDIEIVK